MRLDRVDYVGVIEVRSDKDAPAKLPTPGHAPATLTAEGYLDVDALIARDGLLEYSDGKTTWIEYRPRAELEKSIPTWLGDPVTDEHPSKMVNATTWTSVARGLMLGTPVVEVHDSIAYLRARLRITDAALVKKINAGQQNELSIGFTSEVTRTEGVSTDGIPCDAVQTSMDGNHTAAVDKGRAGPSCRLLLDSAAWTDTSKVPTTMTIKNTPPAARKDEVGTPATEVEYPAPDGTTVMLPTWVVAMLTELQNMKSAAPAPAPGGDAPAAVAPVPVAAPVVPAAPVAGAPVLPAKDADKGEEEKEKVEDAFRSISRRKLDRLASAAGVGDDVLDSNDIRVVARAYIGKVSPEIKTDKMDAMRLASMTEVVMTQPRKDAARPWGGAGDPPTTPRTDAVEDPEVAFLQRQGYGG